MRYHSTDNQWTIRLSESWQRWRILWRLLKVWYRSSWSKNFRDIQLTHEYLHDFGFLKCVGGWDCDVSAHVQSGEGCDSFIHPGLIKRWLHCDFCPMSFLLLRRRHTVIPPTESWWPGKPACCLWLLEWLKCWMAQTLLWTSSPLLETWTSCPRSRRLWHHHTFIFSLLLLSG